MVGINHIALPIGRVFTARTYGARCLRPEDWTRGVVLVEGIWEIQMVVESNQINRIGDTPPVVGVDGRGNNACRVQFVTPAHHGCCDSGRSEEHTSELQSP